MKNLTFFFVLLIPLLLNAQYTLTDNDVIVTDGIIESCSYDFTIKDIIIPEFLDGQTVTGIGNSSVFLFSNKGITSVELPNTLKIIGTEAFYINHLTSIVIPSSVTTINDWAFYGNNLTSVIFGSSSSIGGIGKYAFDGNSPGLSFIILPTHANPVFTNYTDGNGNTYSPGDKIYDFQTNYYVDIPYTLTDDDVIVSGGTIESCNYDFALKVIVIPETLDGQIITGIANKDYYNGVFSSKSLAKVTLPSTLEYIGDFAFSYNSLKNLIIPESVTSVGSHSFFDNNLTVLTISNNMISIGSSAFRGNKLTEVVIPESVISIGNSAFAENKLSSIIIPNSVTTINDYSFYANDITNVVFDTNSNIKLIGEYAFFGWPSVLSSVTLPTNVNTGFIEYKDSNGNSYIPGDLITDFTISYFANIEESQTAIEVTAGNLINLFTSEELGTITKLTLTGTIDARDFKTMRDEMPVLAEIDLSGVMIVEYNGTEGTAGSASIFYPSNSVPPMAFRTTYGNNNLITAILPETIVSIGHQAFSYCRNLTSVNIPFSTVSIGSNAFGNCMNMQYINIPSSVLFIGSYAFGNWSGLINVDENNPNYSSEEGVLYNKTKTSLIQCPTSKTGIFQIPSTVKTLEMYAFSNSISLTAIEIPESVTSIGTFSLSICYGLTSITIPKNVNTIQYGAFAYCRNVTSIYANPVLPVDISTTTRVFEEINKTTCTLYVPYGSKTAYQAANQWQDFQNIVEMEDLSNLAKDSLALVALYYATDGHNWTNNENWLTGPVNTWYGVTVENNRVIGLALGDYTASNNLNGYLPSEIGNLSELRELKLIGNENLTGNLPDEIGKLTSLQYLNLYGCGLSSTIPFEIGNLTNLNYLDLQNCNFTGTIPESVKYLMNLKTLWLSNNNFDSGTFPHWITEMSWLTSLNLSVCNITGNIPTEIELLTGLEYLGLGFNQLSGKIPDEMCALSSTQINLSYNNFDSQSCPAIQCLKDNGAVFTDSEQLQRSGFSLINDCAVISVCPRHFHTVWEGTSGSNHMNINLLEAKTDGIDLEPGDEIAVFDGTLCVGYGKVTQTIDQQNILTINVSRDEGSQNGFTPGNEISYKFWDCSTGTEIIVNNIQCFNTQAEPVTCLPFESMSSSFVKLSAISDICQPLIFNSGWNIISIPLTPESVDIVAVFQPLISNSSLVKIMDEGGSSLEDWGIYGGWKNNIGNVSPTEGYKIKVSNDDNFEICGAPVQYPFAISLKSGWNIMGYPQTTAFDALDVLKPLIDGGKLIKVQDEAGNSIEDWGIYGGWKNNILDFVPGKGYNIKLNADETLLIYESYPKSSAIQPEIVVTNHFKPAFSGNGLDHANINLVGLPTNILQTGDELAVFDGTTCVGAVTLTSRNISNQSVSIAASAKDKQGMPGFAEGNPITLKLWNSKQNREYTLDPEIVKGSAVFAKNETTFASLEKYATTGLGGISEFDASEINCYPNPFSDEINIEIRLVKDSEVQVEVMNQLGQRVRFVQTSKMMNSGVHRLTWDGKNAGNMEILTGIYHLKITVDNTVFVRKMVYSKLH